MSQGCQWYFHFCEVLFDFIFSQRGIKSHWGNPLPIFKHNCVKVFEKYLCLKIVVTMRFVQRDTKAHFHPKNKLILLYCSKYLPAISIFRIMACWHFLNYRLMPLNVLKVLYIINIHNISSDNSVALNMFHLCNFFLYLIIYNVHKFKILCLLISDFVRERRKLPCGNSIFRVQTIMPIFEIETVFSDTVTYFVLHMAQCKTWSSLHHVHVGTIRQIHSFVDLPYQDLKYLGPRTSSITQATPPAQPKSYQPLN